MANGDNRGGMISGTGPEEFPVWTFFQEIGNASLMSFACVERVDCCGTAIEQLLHTVKVIGEFLLSQEILTFYLNVRHASNSKSFRYARMFHNLGLE